IGGSLLTDRGGAPGARSAGRPGRLLLLFLLDLAPLLAPATAARARTGAGAAPAPARTLEVLVAGRRGGPAPPPRVACGAGVVALAQALDQLGAAEHPVALDAGIGGELVKVRKMFGFELGLGHR